jgi:hypothetical protein
VGAGHYSSARRPGRAEALASCPIGRTREPGLAGGRPTRRLPSRRRCLPGATARAGNRHRDRHGRRRSPCCRAKWFCPGRLERIGAPDHTPGTRTRRHYAAADDRRNIGCRHLHVAGTTAPPTGCRRTPRSSYSTQPFLRANCRRLPRNSMIVAPVTCGAAVRINSVICWMNSCSGKISNNSSSTGGRFSAC